MRFVAGVLLSSALFMPGCAYTKIKPVAPDDRKTEGLRIYEPVAYLAITCESVQVVFAPDLSKPFAVTHGAIMAKHDFDLKLDSGTPTALASKPDSGAVLTLLGNLGTEALKQVDKLGALGTKAEGTIPGAQGLYRILPNGNIAAPPAIPSQGKCPP